MTDPETQDREDEEARLIEAYLSEADEQDRAFDAWVDLGGEA